MALIDIPQEWRAKVCAILQTEATGTLIKWTADAKARFEASFLDGWEYEVYDALREYLGGPNPKGCLKTMDRPPGEAYEFFFALKGKKTYGKILLRTDEKSVVVFSAHLPVKDKLDCEHDF